MNLKNIRVKTMKVALVLTSGFKKLAPHVGALQTYFEMEKAGKVPHPYFISGPSAGAVASAACLPWTEKNFQRVIETIVKLKKSDIYSMWHLTELCLALTVGESFLNFIPAVNRDFLKTRRGRIMVESIRTGMSLAAKIGLFYELLEQPSIFSSKPLRRFLKEGKHRLDFEKIWSSDIRLEIPSLDIKTAEMFYFTNYLPEHCQASNRNDILVDAIRASASITAFLPPIAMGNRLLDDPAIMENLPLDRAVKAGCDIIFALIHTPHSETMELKNGAVTWVEELNRVIDLAIDRQTRLTMQRYQETNRDLKIIKAIQNLIAEMPPNPKLPQLEVLLKKLTVGSQIEIKIIPVFCDQPLPDLTFSQFDSDFMQKGVELGKRAMKNTLEKINFLHPSD